WQNRHDRVMTHRFASLTRLRLTAAIVFILAGAQANAQTVPSPQPPAPSTSGQQLLADAAKRVASEPAISAELRYRIDAFGHELVGTGSYLQYGAGGDKLVR